MMNTRCTKLSMVRDDSKSSKTSNKKCPVVLHGDHIIDFVHYINRRYLSVPSGIATATAIIVSVTCEKFLFYGCKAQIPSPLFYCPCKCQT